MPYARQGHLTQRLKSLKNLFLRVLEMWRLQDLLASAYKDLCENTTDNTKKQQYADLAVARYEQAYLSQKSLESEDSSNLYYPCINIAFMHFLCMNYEKAREYADTAAQMCIKILEHDKSPIIGSVLLRLKHFFS